MDTRAEQGTPAGWYELGDSQRYWDGKQWTERYAPLPSSPRDKSNNETSTSVLIWALSLACGVAGALAWDAPVIAYYWPLSLGGAGIALGVVAYTKGDRVPWFALIAVIASLIALAVGISGHSQIEDARESLNEFR